LELLKGLGAFMKQELFFDAAEALEYYALFGNWIKEGKLISKPTIPSFLEDEFLPEYRYYQELLYRRYGTFDLLELRILKAVAQSEGGLIGVMRRAKISYELLEQKVVSLAYGGLLAIEPTREPQMLHTKRQPLKKEFRGYRRQDRLFITDPFLSFWFGFVAPFEEEIKNGDYLDFFVHFDSKSKRLTTFLFERLAVELLKSRFDTSGFVGSYWDYYNEFDILFLTTENKLIVAECKYKQRPITKKELSKLHYKLTQSNIRADKIILISKEGVTQELASTIEGDSSYELISMGDFLENLL